MNQVAAASDAGHRLDAQPQAQNPTVRRHGQVKSGTVDRPLRLMAVVPHPDDFELHCGGSWVILRERLGPAVEMHVVTTTQGATGHHRMSVRQTAERRRAEAEAAASRIGASYACLLGLGGTPLPEPLVMDRELLGGLWQAIRAFGPDVVFCPPVVNDPAAGVHIDHEMTAQAVRLIAYQLMVPHAFPSREPVRDDSFRTPLIINMDDPYMRVDRCDVVVDITSGYATKCAMGACHESQIMEWLPYVQGVRGDSWDAEIDVDQYMRHRHTVINERMGLLDDRPRECYSVTRWGRPPMDGELERLFPTRERRAEVSPAGAA